MDSERRTASPRNTCVPGVQACAVPGVRRSSSTASAAAPQMLNAQPPAPATNRFAEILQYPRDSVFDRSLRGLEIITQLLADTVQRHVLSHFHSAVVPAPCPARSLARHARLIPRLPDPRLGIAARNSSVTPTPTVRPISAAVRRSRSSSCETSAPPRRGPRPVRGVWAAVVGRASVSVIAILEFLRVVENLRQPGPDAVYR